MDTRDPEIAADIRKQMLTQRPESIDQRGFQALLREIPTETLKTASDEKEKPNVVPRGSDQGGASPPRLSEIEQASARSWTWRVAWKKGAS